MTTINPADFPAWTPPPADPKHPDLKPNTAEWYQQQDDETEAEMQARIHKQSELESWIRNENDYGEIADEIEGGYDTGLGRKELLDHISMWIYDQRENAGDEREEELKGEALQTAGEIASDGGWQEKEEEDEDDD